MITKENFHDLFRGRFWSKIGESIVSYCEKPIKKQFLDELYDDLIQRRYYPNLPREYIIYNKHNHVSRIVPTFEYRDYCVYYFCIKQLEPYIAVNRVEGTFGGWTLGNPLKAKEDNEITEAEIEALSLYAPSNTYNPLLWSKNWKGFQKLAYQYSRDELFERFLKFDIANFYDSINLNILEDKIRLVTTINQTFAIELLFHFLKNWNRRFERYGIKTVGIPQDEIGDCSRILANFYLQDYDAIIKQECENLSASYLRFADDQIIFAQGEDIAHQILVRASKELFKINLSINSGKVTEFSNRKDYHYYWAFDIFHLLDEPDNKENVNNALNIYFDRVDSNDEFRDASVLKRFLTMNFTLIEPHLRHRLFAKLLDPDFLVLQEYWVLDKLASKLSDRGDLFAILDAQIPKVHFNSFHYNLIKLYKKYRGDFQFDILDKRITELMIQAM